MSNTWQIENVDLKDVAARSGPGGYVEPVTGAYKVKITGTEAYQKEDRTSVKFQCVIADGEYQGTEMRLFIGADLSKLGNLRSWKTALLSVGSSADVNTIRADQFDNKVAYVYFKAKDPNDSNSQSDKQFITPEAYANLSGTATGAAKSIGGVSSTPAMNVAAPQPGGSNKLRGMLQK
jgi:hypothetical protein